MSLTSTVAIEAAQKAVIEAEMVHAGARALRLPEEADAKLDLDAAQLAYEVETAARMNTAPSLPPITGASGGWV